FLARVVADTANGWDWLRWATPLGWNEELRPFTDPRPAVLVLPFVTAALLAARAPGLARRRARGAGMWRAPPRGAAGPPLPGRGRARGCWARSRARPSATRRRRSSRG